MQINVTSVLNLWGSYVRFTDCKGYPSIQPFMRESPLERTKRRYLARLDDDTLERVDGLIRKLKADNERQFFILGLRYVIGFDWKTICQKLEIGKTLYHTELNLAEQFVLGGLHGANIRLFL